MRSVSGRYINLDRSPERRGAVERQLASVGLASAYTRFAAIDGTTLPLTTGTISKSEYGCFASHAGVLREAARANGSLRGANQHLHVLEDDIVLSEELIPTLERLVSEGFLEHFDLIFTEVELAPDVRIYGQFERARSTNIRYDSLLQRDTFRDLTAVDLTRTPWSCTTSYVAARRSLSRIGALLERELSAGPTLPVDLFLRRLVSRGELKAACVVPFVTSIDIPLQMHSMIRPEGVDLTRLALTILRHALFVRPDWPLVEEILNRYFPVESADPRHRAVGRIMDFMVFGDVKWI